MVVSVATVTNDSNNLFPVDVAAATPGIFTPSGSGRGAAAVLNSDWSLNTQANSALHGTAVHIYATGLGAPTSAATDAYSATAATYPANCISTTAYLGVLKGTIYPPTAAPGTTAASSYLAAADAQADRHRRRGGLKAPISTAISSAPASRPVRRASR